MAKPVFLLRATSRATSMRLPERTAPPLRGAGSAPKDGAAVTAATTSPAQTRKHFFVFSQAYNHLVGCVTAPQIYGGGRRLQKRKFYLSGCGTGVRCG